VAIKGIMTKAEVHNSVNGRSLVFNISYQQTTHRSIPELISGVNLCIGKAKEYRISSNSVLIACVYACMSYSSAWARLRGWVVTNVTTNNSFMITAIFLPTYQNSMLLYHQY
jgi:hypothetical protein